MALLDLLTTDIIKTPLESKNRNAVIRELLELLHGTGKIRDFEKTYQAVLSREAQGSTGLGDGIAIPHAKTDTVDNLILAMGIAPDGIDFDALDGKPSTIFFLILAAPDQSGPHIEALSEIARLTQSKAFMRTVLACRTPEEVLELFE